jgi:diguanylate cyclase (GGDEF)-like protein
VTSPPAEPLAALLAVSRLLAAAREPSAAVPDTILAEARALFGARGVTLLTRERGRFAVAAGDDSEPLRRAAADPAIHPGLAAVLERKVRLAPLEGLGGGATVLLLRAATPPEDAALVLTGAAAEIDPAVATAFADAAAAALGSGRAGAEHERQVAQQQALTRAAKTLTGTLELDTVLTRICHEASSLLGCSTAVVYRGSAQDGLTLAAATGVPPEDIGFRLPAGAGLSGQVVLTGRAMLTNDYHGSVEVPPGAPEVGFRSAMAAPMSWDGELRGVLSVAWDEDRGVTEDDLAVLETFAELAATACANAAAHAGLALEARTDALTGCLNHAALHEGLRREIERAVRTDAEPLSLILLDLDHFKQVNEAHGHLAGDEVLRRAGHALRHATRPYDLAARYGGDEFALLAVGADEAAATDVGARALERIGEAIGDLLPAGASAATLGVAEWTPGLRATELVARADRALLYAKQAGFRGSVQAFSSVPDHFRPGRFARTEERHLPEPPPMPRAGARQWPDERSVDERLRKRTRQLALANQLGARVAGMTVPQEILDAAVEELHRAFGYFCAAAVQLRADGVAEATALRGAPFLRLKDRRWTQPGDVGLIGRCLRTRRPVLANDVEAEPDHVATPEAPEVRSELVVPLFVGDELWGVLDLEEVTPGAFDADDLMLVQTVAAQVGSAMRSAVLYAQLEETYRGTAEALEAERAKRDDGD